MESKSASEVPLGPYADLLEDDVPRASSTPRWLRNAIVIGSVLSSALFALAGILYAAEVTLRILG